MTSVAGLPLMGDASGLAAVEVDIWPENAILVLPGVAGSTLEVLSSDPGDSGAGIGAQKVEVTVLDVNHVRSVVSVTMNGVTPVIVGGGPYIMCESSVVTQIGNSGTNLGIIRTRISVAGAVQNHIPVGALNSNQAFFGVASNENAVITSFTAFPISAVGAIARIRTVGSTGTGIFGPFRTGRVSANTVRWDNGLVLGGSQRIRFTGQFDSGTGNAMSITAGITRLAV